MKFKSIVEEIEFSKKRFQLKKDIENLFLEKEYINYETDMVEGIKGNTLTNIQHKDNDSVQVIGNNGKIKILSRDITTNLLNNLIPNWEKDFKIKLFYYGKIFKNENSKVKEIRQMGAECIGIDTIDSDKEILQLINSIMGKYRKNYILEIGTSEYLKGILNEFYLDEIEYKTIINLINKKNKEDLKTYMKKFEKTPGKEALTNIIDMRGTVNEVLEKVENFYVNEKMRKGLQELEEIKKYLDANNIDSKNIICDLSITSSLNYYSGLMFKTFYHDSNKEIIKGGRYDINSDGYGDIIPAIGFSVEIDELLRNIYSKGEI
ncbi:MAG: ATP phosphoribosyltransferase regulatory subunit [Bacillota bacterium]|nr:ATP phosphoribosyltransferase regulatory subunit [Bacillota bacterium]